MVLYVSIEKQNFYEQKLYLLHTFYTHMHKTFLEEYMKELMLVISGAEYCIAMGQGWKNTL